MAWHAAIDPSLGAGDHPRVESATATAELGLEIEDVTVHFGGVVALDEVSLSVRPGEVVGVIGPNGAGKTTLFNVVCGFVRPTTGTVILDGAVQGRIHPHRLASLGVGRTLQGLGLFPGLTALENVMAGATIRSHAGFWSALGGLPRSSRDEDALAERARAALDDLGVDAGGQLPATLPYAVQKKVALARALVSEPRVLLLDEPASGLSNAEMTELGSLIRRLAEENRLAIALVEHHMDLVMSVCDRVVVLELGRVIASGSPAEVKADPAVTAAYLGEEATGSSGDIVVIDE
jgi:branched-chain amino acid transport system ATP-binding protein